MLSSLWWLGFLAIGAVVGTFAGLLGVGGGMLLIPALTLALEAQGFPREHVLHVAVATAMASVMFTCLSSTRAHAIRNSVRWDIARTMTPGVLVGGLLGASLAKFVPTRILAVYFALLVLVLSAKMVVGVRPTMERAPPGSIGTFTAGVLISGLCSLLAMGGAMLTVPFILRWRIPMIHAIGTAAAVGIPIAAASTVGYVLAGWDESLPRWCLGYVYLPALAAITIASVLAAPLGARVGHRVSSKRLQLIFAALLCALAARMLVTLW